MTKIVYQIGYATSPNGNESNEDEWLSFRKETNLTFPPPLGTEVFVSEEEDNVEHEGTSYYDCQHFEVVGYEHEIGGSQPEGGDFLVYIQIPADHPARKEGVGDNRKPELFAMLLMSAGWKLYP